MYSTVVPISATVVFGSAWRNTGTGGHLVSANVIKKKAPSDLCVLVTVPTNF